MTITNETNVMIHKWIEGRDGAPVGTIKRIFDLQNEEIQKRLDDMEAAGLLVKEYRGRVGKNAHYFAAPKVCLEIAANKEIAELERQLEAAKLRKAFASQL